MIYESRPNVTLDAAALCVKSGNAAILRGGKEAIHSNRALHRVLADELAPCGLPGRRRPARRDDRPRGRRPPARHARPHRPGHPARRREPDPPRRRRGEDAGPEALPRATATSTSMPTSTPRWPSGSSSTPRPSARASATPPRPCSSTATIAPTFLPARGRGPDATRASSCGATRPAARSCPTMVPAEPSDWDTEFLDKILAVGVVDSIDDGDRPHRPPRLGPHRGDPDPRPRRGAAVRGRGR